MMHLNCIFNIRFMHCFCAFKTEIALKKSLRSKAAIKQEENENYNQKISPSKKKQKKYPQHATMMRGETLDFSHFARSIKTRVETLRQTVFFSGSIKIPKASRQETIA